MLWEKTTRECRKKEVKRRFPLVSLEAAGFTGRSAGLESREEGMGRVGVRLEGTRDKQIRYRR